MRKSIGDGVSDTSNMNSSDMKAIRRAQHEQDTQEVHDWRKTAEACCDGVDDRVVVTVEDDS